MTGRRRWALGDSVQVIDRGQAIAIGEPLAVLEQPGQGRVARLVGVENMLEMRVSARLPHDGTMVCAAGDHSLETPLADGVAEGEVVTVGVRASGHHPGLGAAASIFGAQHLDRSGIGGGVAAPGLPGGAGLRGNHLAMPYHRRFAGSDANRAWYDPLGDIQGVFPASC